VLSRTTLESLLTSEQEMNSSVGNLVRIGGLRGAPGAGRTPVSEAV
jgi:hypothetical protein